MKPENLSLNDGVVLTNIMRKKSSEMNAKFSTSFWGPRTLEIPGGSQKLLSLSRVVDVDPQFFDRQKPLSLEPLVGHAGLGSEGASQVSGSPYGSLPQEWTLKARCRA
ncbi:hypothetical protein DAMNIGENAA_24450 [Desulforhabdus amnigena]|uniref:Uncharacterized protein n=2 Tax=Desulforhabdus amnigena TaxID=40218 RepID=A0A9W6FUB7_9BACT|nr:hypothetical protein DAMNIGENAA_24450 [Desulforhabdus amnigena]